MKKFSFPLIVLLSITAMSSCRNKQAEVNPLLAPWDTPYEVPPFDKIEIRHYKPAVEQAIVRHQKEIDSIASNPAAPDFENTIAALDQSGETLDRVYTTFSLVAAADNNEAMQQTDLEISPAVAAHRDDIYLNEKLFERVEAVYEKLDSLPLTPEQKRLTELTYKNFVRAGAGLTPRSKKRLREINSELTTLGIRFGNNLLAENKDFALVLDSLKQTTGLPDDVINAAAAEAEARGMKGKYVFTLGKPSLIPFLTYAKDRNLRERLYRGYLNRGANGGDHDNTRIVERIVRLRSEKAALLGYPSYAALKLDGTLAATPERVYEMFDRLWEPTLKLAGEELAEMKAIKAAETGDSTFASWDWWYYAERLRQSKYDLDEEALKPYLSLDNVKQGVFMLSNRLWGLTFRPVSIPVYHKECLTYEVLDKDNAHLGILYFDLYPREGKQAGAWCDAFRPERYTADGQRVAPVVTVVANFTPPRGNAPALLSLDETETLFHEFGHALNNLFAQTRYKGTGMNSMELDFVEMPSQIMENWATEPEMLRAYAKHYATGETLPANMIARIVHSKLFNQGFMTAELLAAAQLDMDIHTLGASDTLDPTELERRSLYEQRGLLPQIAPRYRYPYFAHIFNGDGYAAGYYSYLWSQMYDEDAYEAFRQSGDVFSRELARSYRRNILERGAAEPGASLYRNFRGSDPDIRPLLVARGLAPAPSPSDTTAVRDTAVILQVSADTTDGKRQ